MKQYKVSVLLTVGALTLVGTIAMRRQHRYVTGYYAKKGTTCQYDTGPCVTIIFEDAD